METFLWWYDFWFVWFGRLCGSMLFLALCLGVLLTCIDFILVRSRHITLFVEFLTWRAKEKK